MGSGFDVSAAVWGSQVYRRFAVECLGSLLEEGGKGGKVSSRFGSMIDLLREAKRVDRD